MIKKGSMVELIGAGWTNVVPVFNDKINEENWHQETTMSSIEPCLGIVIQEQNSVHYYEVLTPTGTYYVYQDFVKDLRIET